MTRNQQLIKPKRLKQLLRRLVNIYSPSGKEEEILHFLQSYLRRHGLPVELQEVDTNRHNLIVMPPDTEVLLAFVGHVDTVMAHDLDHFGYEEDGDLVYGLGAADMKGGCAAMVEAFVASWEAGRSVLPVALALVVGEEEEGDGAQKLAREYHFPWTVIGEPTDLQPCLSHYGYIEVQITATGRRVHASLANLSRNPVETVMRSVLRIGEYVAARRPDMVYNIRDLSTSRSGFAVPDRCTAFLDIHLPPSAPIGEITAEIEEVMLQQEHDSPEHSETVRFANIHSGYELPEKGAVVEALKKVYSRNAIEWSPQAFRSHSDANLFWAAGMKPLLLGPGALEQAHSPEECIPFNDVLAAARLYHDLLTAFTS